MFVREDVAKGKAETPQTKKGSFFYSFIGTLKIRRVKDIKSQSINMYLMLILPKLIVIW